MTRFLSRESGHIEEGGRKPLLVFSLLAIVALMTVLRCPNVFLSPLLQGDDVDLFVRYLDERRISSLFHFHMGYFSLLPQLAGYLSGFFPMAARPYLLATFALAAYSLTFVRLYQSRALLSARNAFLFVLLISLLPLAESRFYSTAMFAQWPLLLLLIVSYLDHLPDSWKALWKRGILLALLIWSNPLSIALALPCLVALWRDKTPKARAFNAFLLVNIGLYLLFGCESLGGAANSLDLMVRIKYVLALLGNSILVGSFGGLRLAKNLSDGTWTFWLAPLLLVALTVLGICLRRKLKLDAIDLFLFYFMVVLTVMFVWSNRFAGGVIWRYVYVQQVCFVLLVFRALDKFLLSRPQHEKTVIGSFFVFLIFSLPLVHFHNPEQWWRFPDEEREVFLGYLDAFKKIADTHEVRFRLTEPRKFLPYNISEGNNRGLRVEVGRSESPAMIDLRGVSAREISALTNLGLGAGVLEKIYEYKSWEFGLQSRGYSYRF